MLTDQIQLRTVQFVGEDDDEDDVDDEEGSSGEDDEEGVEGEGNFSKVRTLFKVHQNPQKFPETFQVGHLQSLPVLLISLYKGFRSNNWIRQLLSGTSRNLVWMWDKDISMQ